MLHVGFLTLELKKRHPLTISRGTSASSENLFVFVSDGERTGVGELAPATGKEWSAARGREQLRRFLAAGRAKDGAPPAISAPDEEGWLASPVLGSAPAPVPVWALGRDAGLDPPALAALDVALWDLLAKQAGMPLYHLLGLRKESVPTSITVGLNPPDVTRERVREILATSGARFLKIKLGSPEGRDFDKAHFEAAREAAAPFRVHLRVDANGGWSPQEAIHMMRWLAARDVDYVEQPLAEGLEEELPLVYRDRPLPIFADESCRFASDVPGLADRVDGVNLKLQKCGGVTDALRIIAAARAHGLATMIGCMSESSVGIAAGAALGALLDHIDLDSHLNLAPDPASGLGFCDGVVAPSERPGLGVELRGC